MLHMDKFCLIKEFSRYVGISPHEYQIELRLSYAKELLKYSDLSVNEIAYACGVNQTSPFYRPFQRSGACYAGKVQEGMEDAVINR